MSGQRAPLGRTIVTPKAVVALSSIDIELALSRHARGDWGIVDEAGRQANERALEENSTVASIFRSEAGEKFYVITEWDRSATTVLLPEDY